MNIWGCFWFGAITNNVAMNNNVHVSDEHSLSLFLAKYLGEKWPICFWLRNCLTFFQSGFSCKSFSSLIFSSSISDQLLRICGIFVIWKITVFISGCSIWVIYTFLRTYFKSFPLFLNTSNKIIIVLVTLFNNPNICASSGLLLIDWSQYEPDFPAFLCLVIFLLDA